MRRALDFGLRVAISIALLLFAASQIEFKPLLHALNDVAWLPLMLSYVLVPVAGYIDANRTKMMTDLQGMTLSVAAICRISFITSFYAMFLPGHLAGGIVKWHRLSQHDRKPAQAFAIIIFGRLFSTIVTVGVGLACWVLDARARDTPVYGIALTVLFAALLGAYWLMFSGNRARRVSEWLHRRQRLPGALTAKLCKVMDAAARFEHLPTSQIVWTAALLVVYELFNIVSFYLLALSIDLGLSVISIGWVRAYVMLVTMLPLSFLGLGVRESSLIALLGTYGLSPAIAVAYSVLLLSRTLLIGMLGGACELWNVLRYRAAPVLGSMRQ